MVNISDADIRFEQVTGNMGAVVHGFRINETDASKIKKARKALHEFGVLIFEFGNVVSEADFIAFGDIFGQNDTSYRLQMKTPPASPFIEYVKEDMKGLRAANWHSDGTPTDRPPSMGMLTPGELPEAGGDTMWANMYAAWDALSPRYQRLLDGLEVQHSTSRHTFLRESLSAVHPAVIRDPVTGRKALYVNSNYCDYFIGMQPRESETLLQMLLEHVNTPEFHMRLRWRLGTIALWEQRVTQHRGVADYVGPRKLRKINFVGDRPTA